MVCNLLFAFLFFGDVEVFVDDGDEELDEDNWWESLDTNAI